MRAADHRPLPLPQLCSPVRIVLGFNVLWLSFVGSHKSLQQNAFNSNVCI